MDLANPWVALIIGAAGSLLAAALIRLVAGIGDFLPRKIETLSVGSSFQPFRATGVGDRYDDVLWIQLRNVGKSPLFVVRAGFRNTDGLPIYVNARRSQALRNAYEVKFGEQWQEVSTLIPGDTQVETYVPLAGSVEDENMPQGKRGMLILDYVYDGRPGRHVVQL
ncbi:hypothetical protein [Tahibacter sp.]|uniref:hypothetical protein n=1 Tax=Tahibacter sp. TaxID=2056211 RepID=UPI0028C46CBD|nr:hypothetical protein [Tahibacter sp.]